jgi:hypothetical protein
VCVCVCVCVTQCLLSASTLVSEAMFLCAQKGRNALQLAEYWRPDSKMEARANASKIVDVLVSYCAAVALAWM